MDARVALQHLLPQHLLSAVVRGATRWRLRPWKNWLIRTIVRRYDVDVAEAASADPGAYPHFNAFFTRALRPGARPLLAAPTELACPADGRISQIGAVRAGRIFQAKGRDYSCAELLADAGAAATYADGSFATIYLSPRDYHRVHMPLAGTLVRTTWVPGRLFSVAPFAVAGIPRLFARNERLVCHFRGAAGPFVVILVGAMLVSGIETVWGGDATTPARRRPATTDHTEAGIRLEQGAEMGRFNMGSTVIVLVPGRWHVPAPLRAPDAAVRVGMRLAAPDAAPPRPAARTRSGESV